MCTPTNMNHEYEGMSQVFGWTNDQFLATNLMAVEAAFVEEDVKQRLRTTLIAAYS
jgi:adenosine deaminase